MAVTVEQSALIDAIRRMLEADDAIEAAWLAGSLGRGAGDAFSDVDILVLAADGRSQAAAARYAGDIAPLAPAALVTPLMGGRVLSVVDEDWRRFDLNIVEPVELESYDAARLHPLFNKSGRQPPRREPTPYDPQASDLLGLVNEFLRVLGLTTVAVGRQEYVVGLTGTDLLRRMTVDLMLEENGVGPTERGGMLRRNPLLTLEQRRALEALPPAAANRADLVESNLALARLFLPRARELATRIGMEWPERFEAATRRHLQARLGVSLEA